MSVLKVQISFYKNKRTKKVKRHICGGYQQRKKGGLSPVKIVGQKHRFIGKI